MGEHKDYEETVSRFERVGGNKETQKCFSLQTKARKATGCRGGTSEGHKDGKRKERGWMMSNGEEQRGLTIRDEDGRLRGSVESQHRHHLATVGTTLQRST